MILVKFDDNYADEFDTTGFMLMKQDELDLFLAYARDSFIHSLATKKTEDRRYYHNRNDEPTYSYHDDEVEQGFGTNEGWRWADYEDFMASLDFQQIDKYTTQTLERLFPEATRWGYGMFPTGMGEY